MSADISGERCPGLFSSHAAVISASGQYFARTGHAPVELHRHLLEAMAVRQEGDYALRPGSSTGDAAEQSTRAEQVLSVTKHLIGPVPQTRFRPGYAPGNGSLPRLWHWVQCAVVAIVTCSGLTD